MGLMIVMSGDICQCLFISDIREATQIAKTRITCAIDILHLNFCFGYSCIIISRAAASPEKSRYQPLRMWSMKPNFAPPLHMQHENKGQPLEFKNLFVHV